MPAFLASSRYLRIVYDSGFIRRLFSAWKVASVNLVLGAVCVASIAAMRTVSPLSIIPRNISRCSGLSRSMSLTARHSSSSGTSRQEAMLAMSESVRISPFWQLISNLHNSNEVPRHPQTHHGNVRVKVVL